MAERVGGTPLGEISRIEARAHPAQAELDGGARRRALERHHALRPVALQAMREGRVSRALTAASPHRERARMLLEGWEAEHGANPDALGWGLRP